MAQFSPSEHKAICRKVADRVFEKADGEDSAGAAGKGTAKTFYAAGTFYEILQQFYDKKGNEGDEGDEEDEAKEQKEEEEQRRKYCKWKAADIINAIKEGREPTPGGYQRDEKDEMEGSAESWTDAAAATGQTDTATYQVDEELPPAPAMPSSDFFAPAPTSAPDIEEDNDETNKIGNVYDDKPPPPYDGIELNLNGDPEATINSQPVVEDVDEDSGDDDIFIPGALKSAATNVSDDNARTLRPVAPPPSESAHATTTQFTNRVTFRPPSPPTPAPTMKAPSAPGSSGGIFSSMFGKSSTKKLSKEKMDDAVELTKFALAALQKGDVDLGKERLQQALDVLNR